MSAPEAFSQKLRECLIKMEHPETKSDAKMGLSLLVSDLMPAGNPQYLEVVKYPAIRDLIKTEGKRKMIALLTFMIKDFCSSVNVVRNMNEDQMIETAVMLLDECGNFRMEDYLMIFTMAKRGKLIKIYDRIDIAVITQMLDAYWDLRHLEGIKKQSSEEMADLGPSLRITDGLTTQQSELNSKLETLSGSMSYFKEIIREKLTSDDNRNLDQRQTG